MSCYWMLSLSRLCGKCFARPTLRIVRGTVPLGYLAYQCNGCRRRAPLSVTHDEAETVWIEFA